MQCTYVLNHAIMVCWIALWVVILKEIKMLKNEKDVISIIMANLTYALCTYWIVFFTKFHW